MERPRVSQPIRRDDRIILHFDYDCFYAQVAENRNPALKSLPLGIRQKGILATCNYAARRRGVRKLMLASEGRRLCPDLVLVDGEDLTPFRDVSKRLYAALRARSWSRRVERLGLDEVFFDATDLVAYNLEVLNRNALAKSFFHLSRDDPEQGFEFDASSVMGCTVGSAPPPPDAGCEDALYMGLLLASHLARYLRMKLEDEGYTSACGISTTKVLAKMAGSHKKPRNQTTLLSLHDSDVLSFVDGHRLRQIPGIGSKTTRILQSHVLGHQKYDESNADGPEEVDLTTTATAGQVRTHPGMSPAQLERLLAGPGSERGLGDKVWHLLHGVDGAEVKPASDVPTQISIEDTYQGLDEPAEIRRELRKLSASLLRRMHADLVLASDDVEAQSSSSSSPPRWLARPRTLRLTTRPKTSAAEGKPYNFQRASRSQPLPGFIFSFATGRDEIVDKLVAECLLPMFHHLNPGDRGWNTGLLNICVTNMVPVAGADGDGGGRDIAAMFRRQEEVLREFTVYDDGQPAAGSGSPGADDDRAGGHEKEDDEMDEPVIEVDDDHDDDNVWDDGGTSESDGADGWHDQDGTESCPECGHLIPMFAMEAHKRFHVLGA